MDDLQEKLRQAREDLQVAGVLLRAHAAELRQACDMLRIRSRMGTGLWRQRRPGLLAPAWAYAADPVALGPPS